MKKYFLFFLAAFFLVFSCSKGSGSQAMSDEGTGYTSSTGSGSRVRLQGLPYDDFEPAFRDVSNLYGRTSGENTGANAGGQEIYTVVNTERKIVRRANVRVRVDNLETAEISINDLMEKYGAYASWTNADENSLRYTIRVPQAVFRDFLAGTAGMGKVISRSESAEDVTLRYYDLEGRLNTSKELLKTFQSYLGKAKNIDEILSVERRIAELQSEIDRTGRDLRGLENDVDYSTVELAILGPAAASISYQYPNLPDQIKGLLRNFVNFLSYLLVIIIGIVVFGIPVVLLLVLFFWLLFGKIGLLKKLWRLAADKKKKSE